MEILFLLTNDVIPVSVAPQREEIDMQEKIALFAATAANGLIFASDLLGAASEFLGMLLGVMP